MNELDVQILWKALASSEGRAQSVIVYWATPLLDVNIFMITTRRCLSTKYSLLLFWHYFFPVFPAPCCRRPVHPCDCLEFTSPPCSRSAPMRGSHNVASCAHVVAPSVLPISISELSLAGLCQLCLLRLLFWRLGSCHKGIYLRFSAPFSFGKPGSSSSGFLSVSRFGSRKVVVGRYRIPALQIVVSDLDFYLVGWIND